MGLAMTDLQTGVADIAEATLADQQFVTPIDILVGMEWPSSKKVSLWLGGFITPLDRCVRVDLADAVRTLAALGVWAQDHGLTPWDTDYAGLRFTDANDPESERGSSKPVGRRQKSPHPSRPGGCDRFGPPDRH